MGGFAQAFALFRRSSASRDSVTEFCVPRAQASRFGASHGASEQRLIVIDRRRWRSRRNAFSDGLFLAHLRPLAGRTFARIGPRRRHGFTQQSIPVKCQIGMRMLERFPHFRIHGLAANLHVGWRPEEIQDTRARRGLARPIAVHHIGVFVAALVADISNERQNLPLFLDSLFRLRCGRRLAGFGRRLGGARLRGACSFLWGWGRRN